MKRSELVERLRGGLIPAVPVPRREDGTLHAAAQDAYAHWMARQPVAGAATWVHTGRGLFLSRQMRRQVLHSWREALGPDQVVVAGAGALPAEDDYVSAAVRMAADAADGGADALLCFAPVPFRDDPDRIVEYHRALASEGVPLILFYLYEGAGGVSYSPDVLRALFSLPEVVAIKMATLDSVMTFQDVAALLHDEFPETVLISGEDRFLGYSLLSGAQGALIGMGAAVPGPQSALVALDQEADPASFLRLTRAVDRFGRATFRAPMEGYIQRMLWALVDTGVIAAEAAFDPEGPSLAAWERDSVRRETREFAGIRL